MDLIKLKKRPSYPFETIVLAVAFTPRLESMLADTSRIVSALGAALILIHVGEKTNEKEDLLENLMTKTGINMVILILRMMTIPKTPWLLIF